MPLTGNTGTRLLGQMPTVHALRHVIWKIPGASGSTGITNHEYYDGEGNLQEQLAGNGSTTKKVVLCHDVIRKHYENVKSLTQSLPNLSNFSPYAFTVVKDSNYVVIYDRLQYNNLFDFCEAMIKDEKFADMMYVEQYILVDTSHQTPDIVGRNLLYWHLVGKGAYNNKSRGSVIESELTVGEYEYGEKKKVYRKTTPVSKNAILENIATDFSNSFDDFQKFGGIVGSEFGKIFKPSKSVNLHRWPYLGSPINNPFLSNMYSSRSSEPMVLDLGRGTIVYYRDFEKLYEYRPRTYFCSRVFLHSAIFSTDFGTESKYARTTTLVWQSKDSLSNGGGEGSHRWMSNIDIDNRYGNFDFEKAKYQKFRELGKDANKYHESTIAIFEWMDDRGQSLYYTFKPVSEDNFSIKHTSDAYNPLFAYLIIEESGKKMKLDRVRLNQLVWTDIFNSTNSSYDTKYGYIGSFSKQDVINWLLRNSNKNVFAKHKKGVYKDLKITILLSDSNYSDGGYFLSPSAKTIGLDTSKLYVTELITKTLETY